MKLTDLLIPVNQDYNFGLPDTEQAEYVNPVTVNYMQIRQANASLLAHQRGVRVQRQLATLRQELDITQAEREDFERNLLLRCPAPAADRKSNKLLDAYLYRLAVDSGGQATYHGLLTTERELERAIHGAEGELENVRQFILTLRLMGEHGRTFLAYVKDEYRRASGGGYGA